jgi:hypothetical protein
MKPDDIRYVIRRDGPWEELGAVTAQVGDLAIDPRLDLYNHSPTGFEFGYQGSGPAQLALAILADFCEDDERALRHYQTFKDRYVAAVRSDTSEWAIDGMTIREWIEAGERT